MLCQDRSLWHHLAPWRGCLHNQPLLQWVNPPPLINFARCWSFLCLRTVMLQMSYMKSFRKTRQWNKLTKNGFSHKFDLQFVNQQSRLFMTICFYEICIWVFLALQDVVSLKHGCLLCQTTTVEVMFLIQCSFLHKWLHMDTYTG